MSNLIDKTNDIIDKVVSSTSRGGYTIERVGKMLENGVSPKVIALQMSETSANKKYTVNDVKSYGKLYEDVKSKVPITSKQTKALINDTKESKEIISEELIPLKVRAR